MEISEIIQYIESVAPLSIAAPWDHSGVQVASFRKDAKRLAVCLDPLPHILDQALQKGAEMIFSHHPLTLKPRFTDQLDAYHKSLSLLFRADVPLYAAHTSLDANPAAFVSWLSHELGLRPLHAPDQQYHFAPDQCPEVLSVLEQTGQMVYEGKEIVCGFGTVGDLPRPLSRKTFLQILPSCLKTPHTRLVGSLPSKIQRIAICPGSGFSLASAAAESGADVLITGDLKYHDALETPLPILDVGHFILEEGMMRRFATALDAHFPDLAVFFIPSKDPFQPFLPVSEQER